MQLRGKYMEGTRVKEGPETMRKLLIVVVFLLFCLCAAAADAADTPIGSDEELTAVLARCKEESSREFELQFTEDYFNLVRENNFARFTIMELKAGIADCSLKYSMDGRFVLSAVQWTEPHVAECATEEEAREAVERFMAEEAQSFQIIAGSEELYDILGMNNRLYSFVAMNGAEDVRIRYTLSDPFIFYCDQIKRYTVPYGFASNEEEFVNCFQYMAEQEAGHFFIAVEANWYNEKIKRDSQYREQLEYRTPMADWKSQSDWYYCRLEYTDVSFTKDPRIVCETEAAVTEAIRQMGGSGNKSFNLILPEELYNTLKEDHFARLHELEAEAGMSDCRMSYNFYNFVLMYTDAVIHSDAVKLTSAEEACAYVENCVAQGKEDIVLFCTEDLYTLLIGNISPLAIASTSMSPIYDVVPQAGINDCSILYSRASHMIEVKVKSLYPGTAIMKAVRANDESSLTGREKETLEAARKLAEECRDADPLTTARNILDRLCALVVYTDDETTDEDDNAIGAILNGQANCDGYADAFYLTGSLAGLEVRYQHGDSHDVFGMSLMNDITHLWNLLNIDGSWRLVDVTWADQANGPVYTWFNLGEDRASRMHIWNRETTVPLLEKTDLSSRPENEYCVSSADDVRSAVKDAAEKGFPNFEIILGDEAQITLSDALSAVEEGLRGSFSYSTNDYMKTLRVTDIR